MHRSITTDLDALGIMQRDSDRLPELVLRGLKDLLYNNVDISDRGVEAKKGAPNWNPAPSILSAVPPLPGDLVQSQIVPSNGSPV
jgi:hypothetical protein